MPSYFSKNEKDLIKLVLDSYSLQHLLTLKNLSENGIIKSSKSVMKWKEISSRFDLIPDQPHEYTHIFLIYSCLLVRYLELLLTKRLNSDMTALLTEHIY